MTVPETPAIGERVPIIIKTLRPAKHYRRADSDDLLITLSDNGDRGVVAVHGRTHECGQTAGWRVEDNFSLGDGQRSERACPFCPSRLIAVHFIQPSEIAQRYFDRRCFSGITNYYPYALLGRMLKGRYMELSGIYSRREIMTR